MHIMYLYTDDYLPMNLTIFLNQVHSSYQDIQTSARALLKITYSKKVGRGNEILPLIVSGSKV